MRRIIYVGLDVHKDSITIAEALSGRGVPRLVERIIPDLTKLLKVLHSLGESSQLRVCYEAGPTGFGLARELQQRGIHCVVVAPSLIPQRPGERIKTDRRDAINLAGHFRAGQLTPVTIPDEPTEAMRDLQRAREDAVHALHRVRQRLDKFLLRHGRSWPSGSKKWTLKHEQWIRSQSFDQPAQERTLEHYLRMIDSTKAEIAILLKQIEELVASWSMGPLVKSLQAMRGIKLITAVTLATEIGNFRRFAHPRHLMAYLGLVPREHSSGQTRRQGAITRTGNRHARCILVEAAWSYRHRPCLSREIAARQVGLSPAVIKIAWDAQKRLCRRFRHLLERGKPAPRVTTAIARELAGFVWAIAQQHESKPA